MRQIPWVRTRASALVFILIFALCALTCATLLLSYGVMFLYLAAPCLLCAAWMLSGRAAADVCAALSVLAFYLAGGPYIALAGAVYLLPAHAVFRVLTLREASALKTGIAAAAAMALSQLALFVWAQALCGGKAYETAAGMVTGWFDKNRDVGDLVLITMNSMDALRLSSSFTGQTLLSPGVLTDAARSDLLGTVSLMIITGLSAAVPAMMVEMSIYQGAMAVLIPRRAAAAYIRKRARAGAGAVENPPLPGKGTPALKTWHLPRGWGWRIGVLSAGYLLGYTSQGVLPMLGQLLFYVFFAVYTLQGIALLNHVQCLHGRRKVWRIIVPLLILLIFQEAMCLLGCVDQVLDIRKLRKKDREEKEDPWEV